MKANSLPSHLKWIVNSFGFDFLFPVIFQLFIVSRKGAVFLVPVFFNSPFHALGPAPGRSFAIKSTLKNGVGGVDGLDYAADIMLSADGQYAYFAGYLDDAVSW